MDITSFDLNLLVAFDALMTERNVTRAGQRINRGQSATSSMLARLRDAFDDELFVRSRAGMKPTPRALELHAMVRKALEEIDTALVGRDSFAADRSARTFRIAANEDVAFVVIPSLLAHLERAAPDIRLEVRSPGGQSVLKSIEDGEIDLAIGPVETQIPDGIKQASLFSDHLVCLMRAGHPAANGDLTLERYVASRHAYLFPLIGSESEIDRGLAKYNLTRRIAVAIPHHLLTPYLLRGTDLIATLPLTLAGPLAAAGDLVIRPVPFAVADYPRWLMWHKRFDKDSGHRWLRQTIHDVVGPELARPAPPRKRRRPRAAAR